jgi:tetratricopeptide (TPR) repeat protein
MRLIQKYPTSPRRPGARLVHRSVPRVIALAGMACLLLLATVVQAAPDGETAKIDEMLRNGRFAEAQVEVDAMLKENPSSAMARFMKGVVQAERGASDEAINTFTRLTKDYPQLAEPYNNLAVLLAAKNDLAGARIALEKAIKINPGYLTAYENLGDLNAKSASLAYQQVLRLDAQNNNARAKLNVLDRVIATNQNPSSSAASAASPMTPPMAANMSAQRASSVQAKTPNAARPEESAAQTELLNVVQAWAAAWSAKDVKRYLAFYGNEFTPATGETRAQWESNRAARISSKNRIQVGVSAPEVKVNGDVATVQFQQMYQADNIREKSRKTLVLNRQNGNWLIRQEKSGS